MALLALLSLMLSHDRAILNLAVESGLLVNAPETLTDRDESGDMHPHRIHLTFSIVKLEKQAWWVH